MWSTPRRLSEASHCSIMWRLWLPAALGSSSSIAPCTLVASTIVSRLPLRSRAFPTASSLAPVLYTFAVSRKLTPPSIARSMMSAESSSPVRPPNIMHPRQSSLTCTPVLPRFLYSTLCSFEVDIYLRKVNVYPFEVHRNAPPLPRGERYALPRGRQARHLREAIFRERRRSRAGGWPRQRERPLPHGGYVDQVLPFDGRGAAAGLDLCPGR